MKQQHILNLGKPASIKIAVMTAGKSCSTVGMAPADVLIVPRGLIAASIMMKRTDMKRRSYSWWTTGHKPYENRLISFCPCEDAVCCSLGLRQKEHYTHSLAIKMGLADGCHIKSEYIEIIR